MANIANQKTDHQMAYLYKESADCGAVIRNVSEQKIGREIEKADFNEQFADGDDAQVIFGLSPSPKISAAAYNVSPKTGHHSVHRVWMYAEKHCGTSRSMIRPIPSLP